MNKFVIALGVSLVAAPFLQAKKATTVKIVSDNVTQQIADKHRHEQVGINLNAVIGDEHVLLMCTDRSKCETLTGDYTGAVHGKKVEIPFTEPVSKKSKKEHFVINGSW